MKFRTANTGLLPVVNMLMALVTFPSVDHSLLLLPLPSRWEDSSLYSSGSNIS